MFGRNPFFYPNLSRLPGRSRVGHLLGERDGTRRTRLRRRFPALDDARGRRAALQLARPREQRARRVATGHAVSLRRLLPQLLARYGEAIVGAARGPNSAEAARSLGTRAFKKVFGKSLGELWEDFEAFTAGAQTRGLARQLTRQVTS